MTQEDKELLLKYLCMALPYGVKIEYIKTKKQYRLHELSENGNYFSLLHETEPTGVCSELGIEYEGEQTIKPYLRSMSSMTDEEIKEFTSITENVLVAGKNIYTAILGIDSIDWLLKNHFDFMGLIPQGLAIEVTEENNPYKD